MKVPTATPTHTVLEGAGKELCQAERHEGEDVIQQDFSRHKQGRSGWAVPRDRRPAGSAGSR